MKNLKFSYTRESLFPGFDGVLCKVNPKIAFDGKNTALLHYSMLNLSGSDVFKENYIAKSTDGGKTFGNALKLAEVERITADGSKEVFFPVTIHYNKQYNKWFATGILMYYKNDFEHLRHNGIGITKPVLVMPNPDTLSWIGEPIPIPLPFDCIGAVPHAQPIIFDNSEMLFGFYLHAETETVSSVITVRYRFDGEKLNLIKSGSLLRGDGYSRGFIEPSLAKLKDKYYITLRTDEVGLFATSDDGYAFSNVMPWRFDDGSLIGNYNTMQRFIRHKDALYLTYTRKGAHNDHIFRHRAPLFMARFDEEKNCLIKDSEVILVPELGARLGNFNVTDVSENEFWLLTAEWMQTTEPNPYDWKNCVKYGADNRIWRAKILFE